MTLELLRIQILADLERRSDTRCSARSLKDYLRKYFHIRNLKCGMFTVWHNDLRFGLHFSQHKNNYWGVYWQSEDITFSIYAESKKELLIKLFTNLKPLKK